MFMLLTEAFIYYILINRDGLIDPTCAISFADSLRLSYFATLGDFTILELADANDKMFWFVFILFTFIQLIIILNMVIAIMGAAFEEVNNVDTANIFYGRLKHMVLSYPRFLKDVCSTKLQENDYLFSIELNPVQNLPPVLMAENPLSVTPSDFDGVKADIRQLSVTLQEFTKQIAAQPKAATQDWKEKINHSFISYI